MAHDDTRQPAAPLSLPEDLFSHFNETMRAMISEQLPILRAEALQSALLQCSKLDFSRHEWLYGSKATALFQMQVLRSTEREIFYRLEDNLYDHCEELHQLSPQRTHVASPSIALLESSPAAASEFSPEAPTPTEDLIPIQPSLATQIQLITAPQLHEDQIPASPGTPGEEASCCTDASPYLTYMQASPAPPPCKRRNQAPYQPRQSAMRSSASKRPICNLFLHLGRLATYT